MQPNRDLQLNKFIPKVSIGMPVFNGEKFIREALDSLLAQTFTDFELIISDNASTDATETICREYEVRDERVRYVRQVENLGAAANFQFVLDEGRGEYFMWAAHDDYRSVDCIEYYLDKIGSAGGVFSTYAAVNRKNGLKTIVHIPILSTGQTRKESLRIFFSNHITSLIYGLFRLEVARECFQNLTFDWADSYFIIQVIRRHGFNTLQSPPKYYACFYDTYVAKPMSGKYVKSLSFILKTIPVAVYIGPKGFFYLLGVWLVTAKMNIKIWLSRVS
jgi:glycosyltransferase involved in cell wall biosynthesis